MKYGLSLLVAASAVALAFACSKEAATTATTTMTLLSMPMAPVKLSRWHLTSYVLTG